MKSRYLRIAGLLLFVILMGQPLSWAGAQTLQPALDPLVRITPQTYKGEVGDVVFVQVWVDNVVDLYGADIQIAFTPGALEVLDANPSLPGVQVTVRSDFLQPDLLLHREADNTTGTIWYAAAQMNPTEPVSGSGVLFEFEMRINQDGIFPITFSSTQLAGTGGVEIVHISSSAVFTTVDFTSTYLPVIIR